MQQGRWRCQWFDPKGVSATGVKGTIRTAVIEAANETEARRAFVLQVGKWQAEKAQAAAVAAGARLGALNNPKAQDPSGGRTLADLLSAWYNNRAANDYAGSTLRGFESRIKVLVTAGGSLPLSGLGYGEVDELLTGIAKAGGYSLRTQVAFRTVLSAALNYARRNGWVSTNAASTAGVGRASSRQQPVAVQAATGDDVAALLSVADPYWSALVRFEDWAGCRGGELAALKWESVNLSAHTVHIHQSFSRTNASARNADAPDGYYVKGPKTARGNRVIELTADVAEVLRNHQAWQASQGGGAAPVYVFGEGDGTVPVKPTVLSEGFARLANRAGVPAITLHQLRHRVATVFLAAGVDVATVAAHLGDSPAVVLDTYIHAIPGRTPAAILAAKQAALTV